MEINKILSSDLLDIIFEGRNKDYGAYELRKTYNNRMAKASIITGSILLLLVTSYIFANKFSGEVAKPEFVKDLTLTEVTKVEPKVDVVPPPKKIEPPKIATVNNTIPVIVDDKQVTKNQMPPDVDKLDSMRIGNVNVQGTKDDGTEPAVVEDKRGIITAPKVDDNDDKKIFIGVEIESSYPGGTSAWIRYLTKTFKYPSEAQEASLQGTVTVQFIVDTEGNVSNVEAIGGPENGGLREEAVRVIKKSGKWEPAIQNGRKVKSYKKQPITFKLEAE